MTETVRLTLLLRRRQELPIELIEGPGTTTVDRLAADFGADPDDLSLVRRVLEAAGLTVISADGPTRQVIVEATLPELTAFFGVEVAKAEGPDPWSGGRVTYRSQQGEIQLPDELRPVVLAVFGLDTRPYLAPQVRAMPGKPQIVYTPPEIADLYGFPKGADGSGQTLAVISLGSGYRPEDMEVYFAHLGLPVPQIHDVEIDGTKNTPDEGREVVLDLQVAGSVAPGARLVNYFAPNSDEGVLRALQTAIRARPTPTVISLSWGAPEETVTPSFLLAMHELFAEAATLGITVAAASGDGGSSSDVGDGGSHVFFPASSPHVLACGGTTLLADPRTNVIHSEVTWNTGVAGSTGGGVSVLFDLPSWQVDAGVPARFGTAGAGRGLPDVAANADPLTGYQIFINGRHSFIGGTSAATPLWAALICRLAQELGRPLGLLQPLLYRELVSEQTTAGFRDVVAGHNGAYGARPGWDANTGLGSPDGAALLAVLGERLAGPVSPE